MYFRRACPIFVPGSAHALPSGCRRASQRAAKLCEPACPNPANGLQQVCRSFPERARRRRRNRPLECSMPPDCDRSDSRLQDDHIPIFTGAYRQKDGFWMGQMSQVEVALVKKWDMGSVQVESVGPTAAWKSCARGERTGCAERGHSWRRIPNHQKQHFCLVGAKWLILKWKRRVRQQTRAAGGLTGAISWRKPKPAKASTVPGARKGPTMPEASRASGWARHPCPA